MAFCSIRLQPFQLALFRKKAYRLPCSFSVGNGFSLLTAGFVVPDFYKLKQAET